MADFIFNKAKGKIRYYAEQVGVGNAALIAILVKSTGLETDASLKDYNDIQTLLAGTTDECDFTNYTRKTISSAPTITQDNVNDRVDITIGNVTWPSAGGATNNTIGAVVFAFDNDTTSGNDSNLVPVAKMDFSPTITTDGTDLIVAIATAGLLRAL